MARRSPPSSRSLHRTSGQRDLPPSLIIVCEGKTEKKVLDGLRGRWRIACAKIELIGEAGVPATVVTKARALLQEHRSRYGKGSSVEVWVVFDRDEHPCWKTAVDQARRLKFESGVSNPCVELWGILLHQEQQAHIERHVAQRLLSRIHPGYHHDRNPYFDLDAVERCFEDASRRATALQRRAAEGNDPLRNPITSFPQVIKRLKSLKV